MIKLTVITSYYNRYDNLKLWLKNMVDNKDIEFIISAKTLSRKDIIIINENCECNMGFLTLTKYHNFSTGYLHNRAVGYSKGKWILKKDIFCNVDNNFYSILLNHLKNKDENYFMVIPAIGYEKGGGTQWVCSRKKYIEIGGELEHEGKSLEDYALIYKLYRLKNKKLKFNKNNMCEIIGNIVDKKNKESIDLKLYMNYKPINIEKDVEYIKKISNNFDRIYEICKQI